MRAAPPFPGTMWAASIYKTHLEPASPFQLHQLPCLSPKPLQHLLSSGPQTAPLRGTPLGCAGLCVTWSHRSPGTLQPRLTLHQLSVSRPNSSFPQSLCRAVPLAWNALPSSLCPSPGLLHAASSTPPSAPRPCAGLCGVATFSKRNHKTST